MELLKKNENVLEVFNGGNPLGLTVVNKKLYSVTLRDYECFCKFIDIDLKGYGVVLASFPLCFMSVSGYLVHSSTGKRVSNALSLGALLDNLPDSASDLYNGDYDIWLCNQFDLDSPILPTRFDRDFNGSDIIESLNDPVPNVLKYEMFKKLNMFQEYNILKTLLKEYDALNTSIRHLQGS